MSLETINTLLGVVASLVGIPASLLALYIYIRSNKRKSEEHAANYSRRTTDTISLPPVQQKDYPYSSGFRKDALPNILWGGVWGFVSSLVTGLLFGVLSPRTVVDGLLLQFLALGGPLTVHAWIALRADYNYYDYYDEGSAKRARRRPLRTYLFRALFAPSAIFIVITIAVVLQALQVMTVMQHALGSIYIVPVWFTVTGIVSGLALSAVGINLNKANDI